jgi:hypothetical protein
MGPAQRSASPRVLINCGESSFCSLHRNLPDFRQHFLKAPARAAGAQILPAKLFEKLLVLVNDAKTAFDASFGRMPFTALTASLERRRFLRSYR